MSFVRTYQGKTFISQIFLKPVENETYAVLVVYSIKNDVPSRVEPRELEEIGNLLMKWLEARGFSITEAKNQEITEILEKSKERFYRQPIALPSREVAKQFLREHWKDILIVITTIATVAALLK